jgi:hypothetical protein
MPKKFTKKEQVLLGRAARRAHSLKVAPKAKNVVSTWENKNYPVIQSLEAKIKAVK